MDCQFYLEDKQNFPKWYKHCVFPEEGLFPLGRTDGGSLIWWHTAPRSDDWFIVIYGENSWDYEEYRMQLSEFIYKYFKKQIDCKGFSESLRDINAYFEANYIDFSIYCQ
jgi:hypothetical protein